MVQGRGAYCISGSLHLPVDQSLPTDFYGNVLGSPSKFLVYIYRTRQAPAKVPYKYDHWHQGFTTWVRMQDPHLSSPCGLHTSIQPPLHLGVPIGFTKISGTQQKPPGKQRLQRGAWASITLSQSWHTYCLRGHSPCHSIHFRPTNSHLYFTNFSVMCPRRNLTLIASTSQSFY